MTRITHQAPIGMSRTANEKHLSNKSDWAKGAPLSNTAASFAPFAGTGAKTGSIAPALVREALDALRRLNSH